MITVVYSGTVPDTFREGRDIIIDVKQRSDGVFVGQGNSLLTKCPSKFNGAELNPDSGPVDKDTASSSSSLGARWTSSVEHSSSSRSGSPPLARSLR